MSQLLEWTNNSSRKTPANLHFEGTCVNKHFSAFRNTHPHKHLNSMENTLRRVGRKKCSSVSLWWWLLCWVGECFEWIFFCSSGRGYRASLDLDVEGPTELSSSPEQRCAVIVNFVALRDFSWCIPNFVQILICKWTTIQFIFFSGEWSSDDRTRLLTVIIVTWMPSQPGESFRSIF